MNEVPNEPGVWFCKLAKQWAFACYRPTSDGAGGYKRRLCVYLITDDGCEAGKWDDKIPRGQWSKAVQP